MEAVQWSVAPSSGRAAISIGIGAVDFPTHWWYIDVR